jgi:arylsulfatase
VTEYPDGRYSTEVYTDRLIGFIDDHKDEGRPFFAFAAYTAPHWPLQVPLDYLDKYRGQYDIGYDRLRELRFESLKAEGIIPESSNLPPRNDAIVPWKDLATEEQKRESRKMELYAAMVENLDFHVGRLIQYLKDEGLYENTIIVFMSDNGAAGEDFFHQGPFVEYIQTDYNKPTKTWECQTHLFPMGRSGPKPGPLRSADTKNLPERAGSQPL